MSRRFVRAINFLANSAVVCGFVGWGVQESIYDVDGGTRAVIFDRVRGILPKAVGEGTHFRVPLMQYPKIMDIRTRPREISSMAGTRDLQTVGITLRLLLHPSEEKLPKIYKELGEDYERRVVLSLVNEVLKAIISKYDAEHLLQHRRAFYDEIRDQITSKSAQFDVIVDDVSVISMTYSPEFTRSCEEKMVAQQASERARYHVRRALFEKEQILKYAEGEAQAATLFTAAINKTGRGYLDVLEVDTQRYIIDVLADKEDVLYLPCNSNYE